MHTAGTAASLILSLPLALAIGTCACDANARTPSPDRSPPARGSFIRVTNCNDSGPGSLRAAVASADSGDYINMRALRCSRVLLTGGAIEIPQDDLTLYGPARELTIDGNQADRVLEHIGSGLLRLRNLSIANGRYEGLSASGGCIDSAGDLRLDHVRVHHCELVQERGRFVRGGGGGLAAENIAAFDSDIFDNAAVHPTDQISPGGGIWARGHLTLVRSRVSDNVADGQGGGFVAEGGLHLGYSEVSGNHAPSVGAFFAGGGELVVTHSLVSGNSSIEWMNVGLSGPSILIANTTVSGNTTQGNFSGLNLSAEGTTIVNSTIANNIEHELSGRDCASALSFFGTLHLESSIVAGNMCKDRGLDILVGGPGEILGSDNIIQVSTLPVPPDTISADPMLLPLADNGGYTRTHALQPGSPAIDMGNNTAGLQFDQRGPGFPRSKGGRTDIGAYER